MFKHSDVMNQILMTIAIFVTAALLEITGCFAFWAWLRMEKSIWWTIPGTAALILFAYLLTLTPSDYAGRAYAAYGGVYISTSLVWLWVVEKQMPDKWDFIGAVLAFLAAGIIIFAPRSSVL